MDGNGITDNDNRENHDFIHSGFLYQTRLIPCDDLAVFDQDFAVVVRDGLRRLVADEP